VEKPDLSGPESITIVHSTVTSLSRYSVTCIEQVEAVQKDVSVDENARKVSELQTELEIAGSEVMRLQKSLEEMEEWKEKLVKESM